ncbi:MAG: lytic murein transglycosylase [Thiotrichales bacterium]|nr:lytic murein transglycosylase [Thiotrichales bacterium]
MIACLISAPILQAQAEATLAEDSRSFQSWLADFKLRALSEGISAATLEKALHNLVPSEQILQSDRKQPEFTRTFFQYLEAAVSPLRVENGKIQYQNQRALLEEVEQKYGVPGAYLVAFWGMETNYGRFTGNLPIIQSLATLAYDPRRSAFFSQELLAALRILDRGDVPLEQMQGSWAGAMGQVQFMPSNYLKYAIDGDGDGKVNLWSSVPDALHSAGYFLQQLGWQPNQDWGLEVQLPSDFDFALADGKTPRPLQDWQAMGVRDAQGKTLDANYAQNPRLVLPSDYRGPAFLVFDNFRVIRRWNNSSHYAIAVGYLADQLRNKAALSKSRPTDDQGLSLIEIKELQTQLSQRGYAVGEVDGIIGGQTRAAIRAFQQQYGLPADGYPSIKLLNQLRTTPSKSSLEPS